MYSALWALPIPRAYGSLYYLWLYLRSLAWPDPFRPGAYQLEIISAVLQGSGTVHSIKTNRDHQALVGDDWKHVT